MSAAEAEARRWLAHSRSDLAAARALRERPDSGLKPKFCNEFMVVLSPCCCS
jgi:hypothetical protein